MKNKIYGDSVKINGMSTQAWGLYGKKDGKLAAMRLSREDARYFRREFNIHRVTVIRGEKAS